MANELTDGERLIRLETEVMAVKEAIFEMKKMLMFREENYVTKPVLDEKLRYVQHENNTLRTDFENYKKEQSEKKKSLPIWIQILISIGSLIVAIVAIFAAILK